MKNGFDCLFVLPSESKLIKVEWWSRRSFSFGLLFPGRLLPTLVISNGCIPTGPPLLGCCPASDHMSGGEVNRSEDAEELTGWFHGSPPTESPTQEAGEDSPSNPAG